VSFYNQAKHQDDRHTHAVLVSSMTRVLTIDPKHLEAQFFLGMAFFDGGGVMKDEKMAFDGGELCFRIAAKKGHAKAQYYLGTCYKARHDKGESDENGTAMLEFCTEWYFRSAEQGYVDAQFALGLQYKFGGGVDKDTKEAIGWFRKAADQDHGGAAYCLGVGYANGIGVAKDAAVALEWHRLAAELGEECSQFYLGQVYCYGVGVMKDMEAGMAWLHKAAEQGHAVTVFPWRFLQQRRWCG
jgi:TPR repeat protein